MIRQGALIAAMAILLAGAAAAQPAGEILPPQPGFGPDPASEVTPPQTPGDTRPITAAGGGPSFVLQGIALEGNTALPTAELRPIWAELLGQDVSVGALDEIATRISAAYRERGFILSQAILPAQTITDGVVRVVVVEGFVDRLTVSGGAPNQQRFAGRAFEPVTGERPLRLTTLERGVLLSRDTFGSVFGGSVVTVLGPSPGTFGAADLDVAITPAPVSGYVTADNRGSRLYGPVTLGAGVRSFNVMGLNERLDAIVAVAPEDLSLAFGQLVFEAPIEPLMGTALDGARLELSLLASRADPDLQEGGSPDGLDTILEQTEFTARMIVPFVRTRSQNLFGRIGLTYSDSLSETRFGDAALEESDRLFVLEARLTWDVADLDGGVNLVEGAIRQGLDIGNARVAGDGPAAGEADFTLLRGTVSRLQLIGQGPWSVRGELRGQITDDVLPNGERFFLGGSTIGRGFAPGNTSGDSGIAGRLEVTRQLIAESFPEAIDGAEIYAFTDWGHAEDTSALRDGDVRESLGSIGLGTNIDLADRVSLNLEIARQMEGVARDTTDPDLETRVFLGLTARF
jgi:hemolysin activation/secretion protein